MSASYLADPGAFTPLRTCRWGTGRAPERENSWGPRWASPSAVPASVRAGLRRVARYLALRFDRESRKISRIRIDDDDDDVTVTTRRQRERRIVLFFPPPRDLTAIPHAREVHPFSLSREVRQVWRSAEEDDEPEWRGGSSVVVVTLPASKVEGPARIHSR